MRCFQCIIELRERYFGNELTNQVAGGSIGSVDGGSGDKIVQNLNQRKRPASEKLAS